MSYQKSVIRPAYRRRVPSRSVRCFTILAVALLAASAAQFAFAAPAKTARPTRPNIIFIMADDLGYGDLGCYGQKNIKTPNLDRMASEGMRFTSFYAGSTVCAPARCVLMTGLHTGHCYIRGNGKVNLRPSDVTVAEVLRPAGYRSALVGKWGLGHEGSTGVPTRQGFDYFFGYLDQRHAHNYYPSFLMRNEKRVPLRNVVPGEGKWGQGVATKKVDYSHDLVAEEALSFVDRSKDKPFFLYLALTIPHANNEAGRRGMEVPELGIYKDKDWPEPVKGHAAMITRMDRDIGRLLARLKRHGIDKNTLVMFTSDNGPHHEGGYNPNINNSSGPLRGTKRALFDGGIRVPLIARWPGTVKAGSTSEHAGYFADLMPTAADLAGQKTPKGIDGLSFMPTLLGKKQAQHEFLYWEFFEGGFKQAVRHGRFKAIRRGADAPLALYDLSEDIGEKNNVAGNHPQVIARIEGYLKTARTPSKHWPIRRPRKKGDVIVYSLLGALLLVLLVIAGLLVKNKKAKVAVLLFFGFVLSFPIAPHALAQTTEAMKPRSMTPAEAHDRLSKALNKLRDELSKLPASGNGDIDDVVGGAQIMISFLEQFGLIDRREAAVQPNYNPPGLPPLPSRCFEDPTGACGVCFSGANRDLDKWRGLLEDQWVIYKRTMLEAGRIVELADAAAGMSPLVKLKWAVEKNNPNEGFNKSKAKFFASYDKNYDELIKRVNDSLIAIGKCERDHFGDPDWYNRYGLPYYLFMRDRYQRK